MSDVFISYARDDQATAERFARALEAGGFTVWWDAALRSGETYDEVIETSLRNALAVIVLWSPHSVASRWVRAEATLADRAKTLIPAMIAPCDLPIVFELTHTAKLTGWSGDVRHPAWTALVADVRRLVDQGRERTADVTQPAAPSAAPEAKTDRPLVMVLPFVNMSGDPEQEYFSDGVSEDIITDLSKVAALSVVSRSTAFSFKGRTVAVAELKRTLGVTHILEGSVRRSGARVRITAQLLDAAHDAQIWAERFDRTLDDIFEIQDELAAAIVRALKVQLAPAEKSAIERRGTQNIEAYELFLLAREFERTGSERMKPLTVRLCRRAVELDPAFAHPWALLALAESEMAQRGVAGSSAAVAVEAGRRAIELAPDLAEAQAALGEALGRGATLALSQGQPYIERALELDPNCYEALLYFGYIHIFNSDFEAAARCFEGACAVDPRAFRPAGMVLQCYKALGDAARSQAAARRSLALCERLLGTEPDHAGALGFIVNALTVLGEPDRAREWAKRAVLFDPDNNRLIYNVACGMAQLNDVDAACDLLERIVERVSPGWISWMTMDNSLDAIREAPRFKAFLAEALKRVDANAETS
ncbi:MAG TPA: TIR domain-containing protein [Caulobacteraceae bacterium]|jgi:adenylate cyclase|nr:TIR domain-containing protein [Caulobacteraceae bacterium]